MENGHGNFTPAPKVVSKQVDPAPYDTPRWYTPRRNVDWNAVDFGWIFYDRDRKTCLGGFLKRITLCLHLSGRWLRSIVQP